MSLVGCEVYYLPFLYLGLPLGGNLKSRAFGTRSLIRLETIVFLEEGFPPPPPPPRKIHSSPISSQQHPWLFLISFSIPTMVWENLERAIRNFRWGGD